MTAYWDTSAILKLIYQEPGSELAFEAQGRSAQLLSWDWMQVEARAAVGRRGGKDAHIRLAELLRPFQWIGFGPAHFDRVVELAQKHRLRSADAGHLYALLQSEKIAGPVHFICFDEELCVAARTEESCDRRRFGKPVPDFVNLSGFANIGANTRFIPFNVCASSLRFSRRSCSV